GERDEDVLRLEIAMDDAEGVGGLEGVEDLYGVVAGDVEGELALALEDARERLALEQLHHDVGVAVLRAVDVHDLDDVGALDLGRHARLAEEALDQARAARQIRVQDLD